MSEYDMTKTSKEEWHKRYKQALMNNGACEKTAGEVLLAGMGEHMYQDSPEESADIEMSYWEES